MTLVLTCLTPTCVFQVSDRRLTDLGSGGLIDDSQNKCVVYNGCCSFAFTGLARLAGMSTDEWIAERLRDGWPSLLAAVEGLRTSLDIAFRPFDTCYHHAIVTGGWERDASGQTVPLAIKVSNFHDDFVRCATPSRSFRVMRRMLAPGRPFELIDTGVPLPLRDDERAEIKALLRTFSRRAVEPWHILALLCNVVRLASERSTAVGKGLLAVVLPKSSFDASHFAVAGVGDEEGLPRSYFVPQNQNVLTQYAPHLVWGTSGAYGATIEYGRPGFEAVHQPQGPTNSVTHGARYLTHWERFHFPLAPSGVANRLAADIVGAPVGSTCTDVTALFGNHIPPVPNVVMCECRSTPMGLDRISSETGSLELSRRLVSAGELEANSSEMHLAKSAQIREWLRGREVAEEMIDRLLDPRATTDEIESRLLLWTRSLRKPGETEELPPPNGNGVAFRIENPWSK